MFLSYVKAWSPRGASRLGDPPPGSSPLWVASAPSCWLSCLPTSAEAKGQGAPLSEDFRGGAEVSTRLWCRVSHVATTSCPESQKPQSAPCGCVASSLGPRQDVAASTGAPSLRAQRSHSGPAAPSPGSCSLRSVAHLPRPPRVQTPCRPGTQDARPPLPCASVSLGCDSVAPRYHALHLHPGSWLGHAGGMAGFPVQGPAGLPHGRGEVGRTIVEGSARACLSGTQMRSLGDPRLEGPSQQILGDVKGAVGVRGLPWPTAGAERRQRGPGVDTDGDGVGWSSAGGLCPGFTGSQRRGTSSLEAAERGGRGVRRALGPGGPRGAGLEKETGPWDPRSREVRGYGPEQGCGQQDPGPADSWPGGPS